MSRLRRIIEALRPASNNPSAAQPPLFLVAMVIFGLVSGVLLLLLLLPETPALSLILLGIILGTALVARRGNADLLATLRAIFLRPSPEASAALQPLSLRRGLAEIGLIVVVVLIATFEYVVDDPSKTLNGGEVEWQVHSIYLAEISLREHGYIPLWNPYFESGHPLIDKPQSVILNPFSSFPGLLLGGQRGVKIGVVVQVLLAGTGGWFLGRVLGLAGAGRLLLALLLTGRGNMIALMGQGYYQLGTAQAYFPWVIGGMLALLRTQKRWPVVLTALMSTLLFWGGNIWYTLPTMVAMIGLTLTHTIRAPDRRLVRVQLRRVLQAAAITLALSAVTLLPIWAKRDHIGGHPSEIEAGVVRPLAQIVPLYFDGGLDFINILRQDFRAGYVLPRDFYQQQYYSFVVPQWFVILFFVLLPPIAPRLHRSGTRNGWQIWTVGLLLIVVATLWGAGGNPLFVWLYANVPLLAQWRFVGRALAVGSFWIALLAAMRFDSLWRALLSIEWRRPSPPIAWGAKRVFVLGMTLAAGMSAYQTNSQWGKVGALTTTDKWGWSEDDRCISWLREQHPEGELTVYMNGYRSLITYFRNDVRLFNIEADYQPLPLKRTLGNNLDLAGLSSLPDYVLLRGKGETSWFAYFIERHYRLLLDSPSNRGTPCLWYHPDALSYAFSIPIERLRQAEGPALDPALTTPITALERLPDRVALLVEADPTEALVVTVREVAFPGWRAEVDGEAAQLESVGGQVGVVLPAGSETHRVYFEYGPPLVYAGGVITLLACAFCMVYLLGGGRRGRP